MFTPGLSQAEFLPERRAYPALVEATRGDLISQDLPKLFRQNLAWMSMRYDTRQLSQLLSRQLLEVPVESVYLFVTSSSADRRVDRDVETLHLTPLENEVPDIARIVCARGDGDNDALNQLCVLPIRNLVDREGTISWAKVAEGVGEYRTRRKPGDIPAGVPAVWSETSDY